MVYPVKSSSLVLLCCILRLTSASCTFEIYSQSGEVHGSLSCPGCNLSLADNGCNLHAVFEIDTNCSGRECNRTYHLCNGSKNTITPATVTVCPMPTPSLTKADPPACNTAPPIGAIDNSPQLVVTTVLCSQHTDSDINERNMECTDMMSIQAMGAVIVLLIVLLVVMTSGYMYICWNMKKSGRLRTISKQMTSFPNTRSIINTLNRTDKTLRQFNNPKYDEGGPNELSKMDGVEPLSVIQPKDGEPAYEAIPLSGISNRRSFEMSDKYHEAISHHEAIGDKQMQAVHGSASVGVASLEGCGHGALELELSQVGLENEDIENHYHLIGSEELDRQSGQDLRDAGIENHYHLLDSEQEDEKNSQMMKDNNYHHILEQNTSISQEKNDVGTIESDYYLLGSIEEAVEQEREESVYHVLEMSGHDDNDYEDPDEGDLFRDYDERKREREIERSTREPCAYKVPVKS